MKHYPLIRTIYLYLFALVGLTLVVIGLVQLVNLGLKVYVFPESQEELSVYKPMPPEPVSDNQSKESLTAEGEKIVSSCQNSIQLTDKERSFLSNWEKDYEAWKNRKADTKKISRIQNEKEASRALAFILIGLPLYFYHWLIIKKETVKNKEESEGDE